MGLIVLGFLMMLTPFALSAHDIVVAGATGSDSVTIDVLNVKIKLIIVGALVVIGGMIDLIARRGAPTIKTLKLTEGQPDWRSISTDLSRLVGGLVVFWAVFEIA